MTHRLQFTLVYQNSPYQTLPQLTFVATGGSSLNIQLLQVPGLHGLKFACFL